MRFARYINAVVTLLGLIVCQAPLAGASPAVSISSGGGGVFIVQGTGFDKVAGAKITVVYDTTTLANPRVTQGSLISGALMASNTAFPGTVTLATISYPNGVSGNGPIATIAFDLPGSSLGVITALAADLASVNNGAKLDVQTQIYNPSGTNAAETDQTGSAVQNSGGSSSDKTGQEAAAGTTTTATTPAASGGAAGAYGGLGDVSITTYGTAEKAAAKGEQVAQAPAGGKDAPPAPPETRTTDPVTPAPDAAQPQTPPARQEPTTTRYTSALERFRTFTGVKTCESLSALITHNDMQGIRQEPPVALSDGKATVRLIIASATPGNEAPSFALDGAKLVSLKKDHDNAWIVEALPAKGTDSATIRMLRGGSKTEIPLTVAPPLSREARIGSGATLTDTDVKLFLKERGTEKAPRHDLNGDGKRDYIDDYIVIANYLAQLDLRLKVTTKEQK